MKILGIDPGYGRTGWAIVEKNSGKSQVVACDCIETSQTMKLEHRLLVLHTKLTKIFKTHKPQLLALEKLYAGLNKKTVIGVAQGRGVVILLAAQHDIPIFEISPNEVKLAVTGYGKADKHQVRSMIKRLYNGEEIPKQDDAVDALAIAYTVSVLHGSKQQIQP